MTIYSQDSQYGPLRAFFIYLLIELRLSYQKAIEHVSSLFDVALPNSTAYDIKLVSSAWISEPFTICRRMP